jgi:hypothetical protein
MRRPRPEHADTEERPDVSRRSDALEQQGQDETEEIPARDVDGERRPREVPGGRRPSQPELVAAECSDEPTRRHRSQDVELASAVDMDRRLMRP